MCRYLVCVQVSIHAYMYTYMHICVCGYGCGSYPYIYHHFQFYMRNEKLSIVTVPFCSDLTRFTSRATRGRSTDFLDADLATRLKMCWYNILYLKAVDRLNKTDYYPGEKGELAIVLDAMPPILQIFTNCYSVENYFGKNGISNLGNSTSLISL